MSKTIAMKNAVEKYLAHLEDLGKSESTRYTVTLDLRMLTAHLGEDKELAKILPVHVAGFFKSDPVNKIGDPARDRRPATVLQIKRITRQFLVWAEEQGYMASVPLPKEELEHVKAAEADEKPAKPKVTKGKKRVAKKAAPERDAAPKGEAAEKAEAKAQAE
ncbi:MAG: hypothetical protein HY897_09500 [Deltaproteobacteria bacterium]|nr:hypothetical protein [Deltaproteobacteria bacterium]